VKLYEPLAPALCSLGMRRIVEDLIEAFQDRGVCGKISVLAYLSNLYVSGSTGKVETVALSRLRDGSPP